MGAIISLSVCQDLGPHMFVGSLMEEIKDGVPTFLESSYYSCVSPTPPLVSDPILLVKCINKSLLSSFMDLFIWGSRSWELRALAYALLLHYLSNMHNQKPNLPSKIFTKTLQYFIISWNIWQVLTIFYNPMKYSSTFYRYLIV